MSGTTQQKRTGPAAPPLRVFLIDDSAVVRRFLAETLARDGMDVVGTAPDPVFALEKMKIDWPDVVVLDVEMPRMDGISFLKKLMQLRPTPVVMCSTLTEKGCETTLQALAAGAVGVVTKPKDGLKDFLLGSSGASEITAAVRAAARVNLKAIGQPVASRNDRPLPDRRADLPLLQGAAAPGAMSETTDRVVAIGVSTGGVQAVERVLTQLPATSPGLVIVQHMPERFTASFATRLAALCRVQVSEAQHGDRVLPGRVLIAPGGRHLRLKRSGAQYVVDVSDGPLVNHHKPSVDVLMRSVAQCAGRNALGIIMTGMGDDGARGLRDLHRAGGRTLAQDEASCVVYGMPKEAVALGAVDEIVPLGRIAQAIVNFAVQPLKTAVPGHPCGASTSH